MHIAQVFAMVNCIVTATLKVMVMQFILVIVTVMVGMFAVAVKVLTSNMTHV